MLCVNCALLLSYSIPHHPLLLNFTASDNLLAAPRILGLPRQSLWIFSSSLEGASSWCFSMGPSLISFRSLPNSHFLRKAISNYICHCHPNICYQTLHYYHISLTLSYYYSLLTLCGILICLFLLEYKLHEDRGHVCLSASSVAHKWSQVGIW